MSSLQSMSESLFAHEDVSEELWRIAYRLVGGGIIFSLLGLAGVYEIDDWTRYLCFGVIALGALMGLGGAFMISNGQENIPSDPVSVAILRIWGKRQPVLLPEGDKMKFPWWPFRITYALTFAGSWDFEWEFKDIPCKAPVDTAAHAGDPSVNTGVGGSVTITISGKLSTDTPHPLRVLNFQNKGGVAGTTSAYRGVMSESLRQVAALYDTNEIKLLKAELVVALIVKTTDADFRELPRNADGTITQAALKITPEQYKRLPVILDPYDYFFRVPTPAEVAQENAGLTPEEIDAKNTNKKRCRTQEIDIFLRVTRENGVSDIIDLGLIVNRLNVDEIKSEGELGELDDTAAVEQKQREGETWDFETEEMLAQRRIDFYKKNHPEIPIDKAFIDETFSQIRANRGRAEEFIVRTIGDNPNNTLTTAAAVNSRTPKGK